MLVIDELGDALGLDVGGTEGRMMAYRKSRKGLGGRVCLY